MDSKFIILKMGEAYEIRVPINVNVANEVFNKLGKELLDVAYMGRNALNTNIPTEEIITHEVVTPPRVDIKDALNKICNSSSNTKETNSEPCMSVRIRGESIERDPDAKFTFYKCPKCGRMHYGFVKDLDVAKCYGCGAEIFIKHEDGEYTCPCCNYKATFKVGTDNIKVLRCKECNTDIDMKFNENKKKYVSL